jgi:hypothetical protein
MPDAGRDWHETDDRRPTHMGKFGRSLALARSSWAVLRADKELIVLPAISGAISLVVAASFMVPIFFTGRTTDPATGVETFHLGWVGYTLMFAMYSVLAYVTIFFNTALICGADERMRGGNPTLGTALDGAVSRAGAILPWAIISATVSMILRTIQERTGVIGRLAVGFIGVAWTVVTFLVLPTLVIEGIGVVDAIKRSADLCKRTWGENLIGNAGLGLLGGVAAVVLIGLAVLGVMSGTFIVGAVFVVIAVVGLLVTSVVLSALGVVYQLALYRFATTDEAPAGFARADLTAAFTPKVKKTGGWMS